MTDDRVRLVAHELVHHLGQILCRARLLHIQRQPRNHEEQQHHGRNNQLFREPIVDRGSRPGNVDS